METLTAFSILVALILFCFIVAAVDLYSKTRNNLPEPTSSPTEKITTNTTYWKVVKGVVTESKLEYKDERNFFGNSKRLYRARFSYEYYAYDKKYTHSSLLLTWTPSKQIALEYVDRYPKESKVIVRFHPDHPETSVMDVATQR